MEVSRSHALREPLHHLLLTIANSTLGTLYKSTKRRSSSLNRLLGLLEASWEKFVDPACERLDSIWSAQIVKWARLVLSYREDMMQGGSVELWCLRTQLKELDGERVVLQHALCELEKGVSQSHALQDRFRQELESKCLQNITLTQTIAAMNAENERLRSTCSFEESTSVRDLHARLEAELARVTDMKTRLEAEEKRCADLQRNLAECMQRNAEMEIKISALASDLQQSRLCEEEMCRRVGEQERSSKQSSTRASLFEFELKVSRDTLEALREESMKEIHTLKTLVTTLQQQQQSAETVKTGLGTEVCSLSEQLQTAMDNIRTLTKEKLELTNALNASKEQAIQLEAFMSSQRGQTMQHLEQRLAETRLALAQAEAENDSLEQQVQILLQRETVSKRTLQNSLSIGKENRGFFSKFL
eukprot:GILJ01008160.1.p1 GENE.GILJ01008160.1~~GILJ01008160.1.p1  ORF type:complete len:417 (-),score=55.73 GILJ01008160.1:138-1388(-)